jgi:hypothetical protein
MRFPAAVLAAILASAFLASWASASAWATAPATARATGVVYDFFQQPLNHSDHSAGSFVQRVLINSEFAKDDSAPSFVFVGGQSALDASAVTSGFIYTVAKTHGARIFALEHRYYGESVARQTLSTGALQYLTVHNAIDDLAGFLDIYTGASGKPLSAGPVILFGSEYGGMVASLLRARYPALSVAAVAASATMRPVSAFLEYGDNLIKLVADLWNGPTNCAGTLATGLKDLRLAMYDKTARDIERISTAFNTCSETPDFESPFIIQEAFVAALSQVLTRYLTPAGIKDMCGILGEKVPEDDNREIWSLGRFVTAATAQAGKPCFSINREALSAPYQSSMVADHKVFGLRQSLYLSCTVLGTFPSSNGFFSAEAPYFESLCYDVFGLKETNYAIANEQAILEREFGGLTFKGERVYFTNAQIDPYNSPRLAIVKANPSKELFVLESSGVTRATFLGTESSGSLKTDRAQVATQIAAWLAKATGRSAANTTTEAETAAEEAVPVVVTPTRRSSVAVSDALLRLLKL